MSEDTTDLKDKARIEDLFRAPPPWYNDPKVVRRFTMAGAIIGGLISAYLSYRS